MVEENKCKHHWEIEFDKSDISFQIQYSFIIRWQKEHGFDYEEARAETKHYIKELKAFISQEIKKAKEERDEEIIEWVEKEAFDGREETDCYVVIKEDLINKLTK